MALRSLTIAATRIAVGCVRSLPALSLVVPYYHMVGDSHVPHVSHLYRFRTIAEFNADLEFLLTHFCPVGLRDIIDALDGRCTLRRPCFHLTFDDGFAEMHDVVAPILHRAGVPATFFLATAFLDGGGLAHHNALSVILERIRNGRPAFNATQRWAIEALLPTAQDEPQSIESRIMRIHRGQR